MIKHVHLSIVYLPLVQVTVSMSSMYPKEHVHISFIQAAFEKLQSASAVQASPRSPEGVAVDI